jgi:hypothetical protein
MKTWRDFLFPRRAIIVVAVIAVVCVCAFSMAGYFRMPTVADSVTILYCVGVVVGFSPVVTMAVGVIVLFCACYRKAAVTRRFVRAAIAFLGIALIWCGALDKIESVYICDDCLAVRITTDYRLMGVILHESHCDYRAGKAMNTERDHKWFLEARFRYPGLVWWQYASDSPPPGIKKLH